MSAPSHDAPAKPGVPVFESCAATCPTAFVEAVVVTDCCNPILTSDAHGETLEGTSRNLSTRVGHRHSASPRGITGADHHWSLSVEDPYHGEGSVWPRRRL